MADAITAHGRTVDVLPHGVLISRVNGPVQCDAPPPRFEPDPLPPGWTVRHEFWPPQGELGSELWVIVEYTGGDGTVTRINLLGRNDVGPVRQHILHQYMEGMNEALGSGRPETEQSNPPL